MGGWDYHLHLTMSFRTNLTQNQPTRYSDGMYVWIFVEEAGKPVSIAHGLGTVPRAWEIVDKDKACDAYRQIMDAQKLVLVFDTANTHIVLRMT